MSENSIRKSTIKTTSWAYAEKLAKERGWKIAPKDHPIYSEGSTIMFVNLRPKLSQKQAIRKPISSSEIPTD